MTSKQITPTNKQLIHLFLILFQNNCHTIRKINFANPKPIFSKNKQAVINEILTRTAKKINNQKKKP
jgi:hypothetical protein